MKYLLGIFILTLACAFCVRVYGDDGAPSPWLVAPLFSSSPKLGNSLGVMGAYLRQFDPESPTSLFGLTGKYSDSDSLVYAAFANTYFHQDKRRLMVVYAGGEINNEYNDFLGSGWPLQSQDSLKGLFVRYNQRWRDNWFWGVLASASNYSITGTTPMDNNALEIIGLTGFDGVSLGLMLSRDSRDNQNSPTSGSYFEIQNRAYREGFGSDEDFDAYSAQYLHFAQPMAQAVLATRLEGRWTHDAPTSGFSSINMRGYTRGEYLAPNSLTGEIEYRMPLPKRFGLNFFTGISALYDELRELDSSENWYASAGMGLTYQVKTEQKMIVRSDLAFAEAGRVAFYLQFGQAF